ncbi:mucin-2-like [Drosophila persimilis]|uniref:mucin-2-like n=1 Tax=Drosophila persimilis TaxID=7234 RepID=UPI000F0977FB|nr:mucin-2-like [Drosophila persimilis]
MPISRYSGQFFRAGDEEVSPKKALTSTPRSQSVPTITESTENTSSTASIWMSTIIEYSENTNKKPVSTTQTIIPSSIPLPSTPSFIPSINITSEKSFALPFIGSGPPGSGQTEETKPVSTNDLANLLSTSEKTRTETDASIESLASLKSSAVPFNTIEPPEGDQTEVSPPVSVDSTERGTLTSDLVHKLSTPEGKRTDPDASVESLASLKSSALPFATTEPPEGGQTEVSPPVLVDSTERGTLRSDLVHKLSTPEENLTELESSVESFASLKSSVLPYTTTEPPEGGQLEGPPTVSADSTEKGLLTSDTIQLLTTSEKKHTEPDASVESLPSLKSSALPFTTIEPPEGGQTEVSPPVSADSTERGILTSDLIHTLSTPEEKRTEPDASVESLASLKSSALPFNTIEPPEGGQTEVSPPVLVDSTERGILTSDLIHTLSTPEEKRTEPDDSVESLASLKSSALPFNTIEPSEGGQTEESPPVLVDSTERGTLTSDLVHKLSTPEENLTELESSVESFASLKSSVLPYTTTEPPEGGQLEGPPTVSADSTEKGLLTSDTIQLLTTSEKKHTEPDASVESLTSLKSSALPFTLIEPPEGGQTEVSPPVSVDSIERGTLTSDLVHKLSTPEENLTELESPVESFASLKSSVLPYTTTEPPEGGQLEGPPTVSADSTEKGLLTSDTIQLLTTSEEKHTEPDASVESLASLKSSALPFATTEPPEGGQTEVTLPVSADSTESGILASDLIHTLSTPEEKRTEPDASVESLASLKSSALPFNTIEQPEGGQTEVSPPVSVDSTERGTLTSDLVHKLSTPEENLTELESPVESFASLKSSVLPYTTTEPPEGGQLEGPPTVSADSTEKGLLTSDIIQLLTTSEEEHTEPDASVESLPSLKSSALPFNTIEPPEGGQTEVSPPVSVDSTERGTLTSDLVHKLSTPEENLTELESSVESFASLKSSVIPYTTTEAPEGGQLEGPPTVAADSTEKGLLTSDIIQLLTTSEEKHTESDVSAESLPSLKSSALPFTTIEPPEGGQTEVSPPVSADSTESGILTSDLIHTLSTPEDKRTEPDASVESLASLKSSALPFNTIEPPEGGQTEVSPPVSVDSTERGTLTSDLVHKLSTPEENLTELESSVASFASLKSSVLPYTTTEPPEGGQLEGPPTVLADSTEKGLLTSDIIQLLTTSEEKHTESDFSAESLPSLKSSALPFTTIEPPEGGQTEVSPPVSADSTERGILTSDLIHTLSTPEEKRTETDASVESLASLKSSALPFNTIEPPEGGQTEVTPPVSVHSTERGILTSDLIHTLSTLKEKRTEPDASVDSPPSPTILALPLTTTEPPDGGQSEVSLPVSVDSTERGILTSDLIHTLSTPEEKRTEPDTSVESLASVKSSALPFTTIEPSEGVQTEVSPPLSGHSTERAILTSGLVHTLSTSEKTRTEPDASVESLATPTSSALPFTTTEPAEGGQTEVTPPVSVHSTERGILTSDLIHTLSTPEEKRTEPDTSVESLASVKSSALPFTTIEPPDGGQSEVSPPVSVDSTERGILTSDLIETLSTPEQKRTEPDASIESLATLKSSALPFTTTEPPEGGQTEVTPPVSVHSTERGILTSDLFDTLSTPEEKRTEPDASVESLASLKSSALPFATTEPPEGGQSEVSPPVSVDSTERGILTSDLIETRSTPEQKRTEPDASIESLATLKSSALPFTTIEPPDGGQSEVSPPVSVHSTERGILTSDLFDTLSTPEEKRTEPDASVESLASLKSSALPFATTVPPEGGQSEVSPPVSVDSTERGILTSDLINTLSTPEEKRTEPDASVESLASLKSTALPFATTEPPEGGQSEVSPPVSVDSTERGILTSDLINTLSTPEEKRTEPDVSVDSPPSPTILALPFTTTEPPDGGQSEVSPPVSVDSTERGILTSDLIHKLSTLEEKRTEPDASVESLASLKSSALPFTTTEPPEGGQSEVSPPVSVDSTESGILTSDLFDTLSTPEEKRTEPDASVESLASLKSSALPFATTVPPEGGQSEVSPPVSVDSTERGILTSDLINTLSTPEEKRTEPDASVESLASLKSSALPFATTEPPEGGQSEVSPPVSVDSTERGILTSDFIDILSTPEEKRTEPDASVESLASLKSSALPFATTEPPEGGQSEVSPPVSVDSTERGILTSDFIDILSTPEEKRTEPDASKLAKQGYHISYQWTRQK